MDRDHQDQQTDPHLPRPTRDLGYNRVAAVQHVNHQRLRVVREKSVRNLFPRSGPPFPLKRLMGCFAEKVPDAYSPLIAYFS